MRCADARTLLRRSVQALVALCVPILGQTAHAAGSQGITEAGDVLFVALPLAALLTAAFKRDGEGASQFVLAFSMAGVTTEGLKALNLERRPDGSNEKSLPSGHAANAFSAAAFVRARYDWQTAVPFYALAAFTGYSRVQARKHYWHDIAASALIAEGFAWAFVTKDSRAGAAALPGTGFDARGITLVWTGTW